jgi:hypothetical protein
MRKSHGQYFMNQGRSMGIEAKIDPKVQQLNKRDMELTVHKRRRVQQQRNVEKNKSKDKFDRKNVKKRAKNPYRNVESKIKDAVRVDKLRYLIFS